MDNRKMRNAIIAGASMILLVFSGCKEVDKLLTFTIDHQVTFQIENSSPVNLPIEISTPDVATNSSQTFQNNNTNAGLVKDVKLQEIKLTVVNPSGKTFSFLKSITLFISTSQTNEIELASLDNIPATATIITLTPTNANLDAFVKASSYKLRTSLVMRETLTEPVDVRTDLKFKVTAASL
jgi:hypothetical protein